jgi:large subunit ribosomal protein L32
LTKALTTGKILAHQFVARLCVVSSRKEVTMAVQQTRKTRARRDKRRSHDHAALPSLSTDSASGTFHRRHHIARDGFYRGVRVIPQKAKKAVAEEESNA